MITLRDADDLLAFLASLDGVYDAPAPHGDPVDLLQHGLQCAAVLRATRPDDLGLQVAGLVHDIGHAVDTDNPDHAATGAAAIRAVLGARVATLVGLHVQAKRYLATTEAYELSPASVESLARQGSLMTDDEREAFERLDGAEDAVELRRADEAAKVIGLDVAGLDTWAPRLREFTASVSAE